MADVAVEAVIDDDDDIGLATTLLVDALQLRNRFVVFRIRARARVRINSRRDYGLKTINRAWPEMPYVVPNTKHRISATKSETTQSRWSDTNEPRTYWRSTIRMDRMRPYALLALACRRRRRRRRRR
jgi:hypothetical protein